MSIEKIIFDKPSGQQRGIVVAKMELSKKERRVGHAFLNVDGPASITLDIPKGKLSTEDVTALGRVLAKFAAEVAAA